MPKLMLPKCLQRYAHLIADVSDERGQGDGYWVYLAPGLWSPENETHCIHEDYPRDCIAYLKYVEPCPCCPKESKKR